MTSLNTNIGSNIPIYNPQIGQPTSTQSPPITGTDRWDEIKDTQSSGGTKATGKIQMSSDPTIPILPSPDLSASTQVEISKTKLQPISPENLIQKSLQNLQQLTNSAATLSQFLPADHPEQVNIQDFLKAIRGAIDQLKKVLANIQNEDSKSKSKGDKANNDSALEKLSATDVFQKLGQVRAKTDEVGKTKTGSTILSIFILIFSIALLFTCFMPLGWAGVAAQIVNLAPGKDQGYMLKGKIDTVSGQRDQLNDQINKSWAGVAPAIIKFNNKLGSTEEVIIGMISILMKLLAKILMGAQLGTTDVDAMKKALANVKNPATPPELQEQMSKLMRSVETYSTFSPSKVGEDPKKEKNMQLSMQMLSLYTFYREKGDTAGANQALESLQKSLNYIAGDIINDPGKVITANAFKEISKGSDNGTGMNVNHHPA